ncbi:MAG: GIY-YIG nuclease family protein [Chloroflexi bacterium]|nr:GIY-YIG nuclease family protein [Chloroflexota bacterium]
MPSDSAQRPLREAISREVPCGPGVYLWAGEDGQTLYVGKSVNLRARMLSYLVPAKTDPHSRVRHLASAIRSYSFRETPGELGALLLEDALIKLIRPRYNVRQREELERRYLALTADSYPTCLVVEGETPRPATLFGPFKDQFFVSELIALICEEFGLRACQDRDPYRRSARYDLGFCPGPCRGAISTNDYSLIVERVRAFLEGDASWLAEHLTAGMGRAADDLRFEEAATARERLAFARRFAARQRFIGAFRGGPLTVDEPARGLSYSFERGRLARVVTKDGSPLPLPPELDSLPDDPCFLLDRANIVYQWGRRRTPPAEPMRQ